MQMTWKDCVVAFFKGPGRRGRRCRHLDGTPHSHGLFAVRVQETHVLRPRHPPGGNSGRDGALGMVSTIVRALDAEFRVAAEDGLLPAPVAAR